jgi:hypothetical protein
MSIYSQDGAPPVIPNAMAQIERRLDNRGTVLARVGGRVEPEDTVAKAFRSEPPLIINVARVLGIPPSDVERAMRREVGNKVAKGDTLASTSPLAGRKCTAPVGGMITAVNRETGYVTLAPEPVEYQLEARVRGIVMQVLPDEGVIIETPAAQVYGAFGIGDERSGVLRLLVTDPTEMVDADKIDAKSAYAILICGAGITAAALRRSIKEQVRGIIVGGIAEAELRSFLAWSGIEDWQTGVNDWSLPQPARAVDPKLTIIVTEGFGVQPMAEPIFNLLSEHDRQEALIEGHTSLRRPLRRPRLIIPLARSATANVEPPRPQLRPGSTVRLLDHLHLGQIARVRSVATTPRLLPSGLRLPAVEVDQPGQTPFWLPRTAVEVLE